ncbi:MAG: hypothetical protein EZS28_003952 [Streblomastix strix]|uniref:IBB domain-containing protein n=1 Tax=Streblomastix strix TaxID=222440 RepID=A0A5J4WZR6_9EUKA|nr:MAG: hypothetical protein EZS28_003952 [Streblomastix strix]
MKRRYDEEVQRCSEYMRLELDKNMKKWMQQANDLQNAEIIKERERILNAFKKETEKILYEMKENYEKETETSDSSILRKKHSEDIISLRKQRRNDIIDQRRQNQAAIVEIERELSIEEKQQFIKFDEYPNIQFEALWTITNMSTGKIYHVQKLVECQVIQAVVSALDSPYKEIKGQAMWALGNLTSEILEFRLIAFACVSGVVSDVLFSLTYLFDGGANVQLLVNEDVLCDIIECMRSSNVYVVKPAIQIMQFVVQVG